MKKIKSSRIRASIVAFGVLVGAPASAGIYYTGMTSGESYRQTSATGTSFTNSFVTFSLAAQSATEFDTVSLLKPGNTSANQFAFRPTLQSNGAYSANFFGRSYPGSDLGASLATMNTAFPNGDYVITASNSVTGASQAAVLTYDYSHWPTVPGNPGQTAVPSLSAPTYANVQGLDVNVQHAFGFNTFVADGVPLSPGEVTPNTTLTITRQSDGQLVYRSAPMPVGTSSILLPAHTLESNTAYNYFVQFRNGEHCGGVLLCGTGNPVGFYRDFSTTTSGQFTTAATDPILPTSVTLQGGTLSNPLPLAYQGQIGQINGTIGGIGSMEFYKFFWTGGLFKSNVVISDADPRAEYEFQLLDAAGNPLDNIALNSADSFTADMSELLAQGTYSIGVLAVNDYDPPFTITFSTPVQGIAALAVPEPGTLSLIGVCLAAIGAARRRRRPGTDENAA